ncbi:MAG TPA: hypothetical protein VGI98_04565 [Candidatus Limnocylindrales bacterium]|jgi:hypothetical protein
MTTAVRPFRISVPTEAADARAAMATIIDVFGIKPRSRLMAVLTGVPLKTLDRAWSGASIRHREQLFLVARFAREVRDYLFADPAWTDTRRAAMRTWLMSGEIDLDGRTYRPIDILADPVLTRRALAELHAAT